MSALSYQRLCASAEDQHAPGLAADAVVELVFDSADALFVDIHVAENGGGQVALGIKALVLFLKIDAAQIELPDARHGVRRQLAGDPHEGTRGAEPRGDFIRRQTDQHGRQQAAPRDRWIGDLRRHGEAGIDRRAHGQLLQIAVEDIRALGADFDDVLLLPLGAGQEIAIAEQLQIGQAREWPPRVHRPSTAATISKRV